MAVPSTDPRRSIEFYVNTLGLRRDEKAEFEFWVGDTCFAIWDPEASGFPFVPQTTAHLALQVDDIEATRAELERKGVEFLGDTFDTGVCHMALFRDPDGNGLMLHHRHTPR